MCLALGTQGHGERALSGAATRGRPADQAETGDGDMTVSGGGAITREDRRCYALVRNRLETGAERKTGVVERRKL